MSAASVLTDFRKMDELSQQGKPFFFMIDFECKNCKVIQPEDFEKSGLLIDFQNSIMTSEQHASVSDITLETFPESLQSYSHGFDFIQQQLRLGNTYLANYTCRSPIKINTDLKMLFYAAKAKYKVCYQDEFLFFSPETFVVIKDNHITTNPMKGTIDAALPNAEGLLRENPKEKAEHYTVVDLLRNDLSMVANEVEVKRFQYIDLIRTRQKDLLAMSSEISGKLKPQYRRNIGSIMQRLLPAGSILGAPKPKTLEIIRAAEKQSRGWYTGVCGWFDGENLDSCVMIRFIEQSNGQLYFRSGGGITHMSNVLEEYEEMKNKIYVPLS